jgi:hypothetical protein
LKRLLHLAVLATVALSVQGTTVHADVPDEAAMLIVIYERAAAHGQSGAAMERLARCESRLDPNAVGDHGTSIGLFQISNRGLFPLFRQWGYDDRTDPWQAADFTARALAAGLRAHWHC